MPTFDFKLTGCELEPSISTSFSTQVLLLKEEGIVAHKLAWNQGKICEKGPGNSETRMLVPIPGPKKTWYRGRSTSQK